MDYDVFYDICIYANNNWKAGMTARELANKAYDLKEAYDKSVKTGTLEASLVCLCADLWNDIYNSNDTLVDMDAAMWLQSILFDVRG